MARTPVRGDRRQRDGGAADGDRCSALALAHWTGAPIIDVGKARAPARTTSIRSAGRMPHAAIAGVFLFLSGLISGYFDNKASYARIGERVARLRWLRRARRRRARRRASAATSRTTSAA
ncbi:MAG: site-specific recombinase [Comamonadaceae bacterium]|nr:site-specific recombinase [Comamonadaceae bacterium]